MLDDPRETALREALRLAEWRAHDHDDLATAYNILTDAIRTDLAILAGETTPRRRGVPRSEREAIDEALRQSIDPAEVLDILHGLGWSILPVRGRE